VEQYLNEATVESRMGHLSALVVPCSVYPLSGKIAAYGYNLVKPGGYDRVIVLTPSHYAEFQGCSIAAVQFHKTSLGEVPVDGVAVRQIGFCPLFDIRSVIYREDLYRMRERTAIHELEHGIEVQLPFLQVRLGEFRLVPVVVGLFADRNGEVDTNAVDTVAKNLQKIMNERTLLVVSTNLTLYGADYGFEPFRDDVVRQINRLDMELIDTILDRDPQGLVDYVKQTGNRFVGINPLLVLLRTLPESARGTVLAYDTTARVSHDLRASVSFATLAFFDPEPKTEPPSSSEPDAIPPANE